mgnify:CR=1 FL=1
MTLPEGNILLAIVILWPEDLNQRRLSSPINFRVAGTSLHKNCQQSTKKEAFSGLLCRLIDGQVRNVGRFSQGRIQDLGWRRKVEFQK